MPTRTFQVTGMTCAHCVRAVTDELSAVDGVSEVQVELAVGAPSEVRVSAERALTTDEIRAAVDEAGYELVES